ncbi:MAG: hypothetical protein ACOCX3_01535 [Chloroflexota bacterium]
MSREIPQRQPVGDPFHGTVLHVNRRFALATDTQDAPVAHQGDFVIRYGVRFLGKQHLAIVPGLLALDYGQMLTGEDAWTFMRENASRYPRADVVGYRHDGTDDMQPLKNLDFDVPFMVLVYADAGSAAPSRRSRRSSQTRPGLPSCPRACSNISLVLTLLARGWSRSNDRTSNRLAGRRPARRPSFRRCGDHWPPECR